MEMKKGFCTWEKSVEWVTTVRQRAAEEAETERKEGNRWRADKRVVWELVCVCVCVVLRWARLYSAVHGAALTAEPKRSLI